MKVELQIGPPLRPVSHRRASDLLVSLSLKLSRTPRLFMFSLITLWGILWYETEYGQMFTNIIIVLLYA